MTYWPRDGQGKIDPVFLDRLQMEAPVFLLKKEIEAVLLLIEPRLIQQDSEAIKENLSAPRCPGTSARGSNSSGG